MTPKSLKAFLDTSVPFAAVFSPTGGARKLFCLAEAGVLRLMVGPTVLREADEVVRRKAMASRPVLAQLLDAGRVETSPAPTEIQVEGARQHVQYAPDARVLAEAIRAEPDWFVTHDKEHFLNGKQALKLPFAIGTPGDLIQSIQDGFYPP
ncbi:MAG: type II toxin-antitoxin system VapC family toxin [Acidobacteriia bacterium]|nr:type II toxin-antitoxin system VapC family toxin [Terriglobia bacterium]